MSKLNGNAGGASGANGTALQAGLAGGEGAGHSGPMIKTKEGYEMPLTMLRDLMQWGGTLGSGPSSIKRPPESYGLGFGRCVRALAKAKTYSMPITKILDEWGDKESAK